MLNEFLKTRFAEFDSETVATVILSFEADPPSGFIKIGMIIVNGVSHMINKCRDFLTNIKTLSREEGRIAIADGEYMYVRRSRDHAP